MKANKFVRFLCLLLTLACCGGVLVALPVAAASGDSSAQAHLSDMKKYLAADSYAAYIADKISRGILPGRAGVLISSPNLGASSEGAKLLDSDAAWQESVSSDTHDFHYTGNREEDHSGAVLSPATGATAFEIVVPEGGAGLYYIAIQYYSLTRNSKVSSIERKLYIDGELPFSEANLISLNKAWTYKYKVGTDADGNDIYAEAADAAGAWDKDRDNLGFSQDLNGNDLTPTITQFGRWQTYLCADSEGYSSDYYRFYLTEGKHTITLDAIREEVVIGDLLVVPTDDAEYGVPTYSEYLEKYRGQPDAPAGTKVSFEAEKPSIVSDSSVAMTNNKNSAITSPSSPFSDLYNVIGASSFSSVGQWAAYNFTVPTSGMYEISMRYLQSALEGMFISRTIRITSNGEGDGLGRYGLPDGTAALPFREAFNTRFNYVKDWQISSLTDGNATFKLYFQEGVHYTIYFEVGLGALAEQLQIVENAMTELNSCYLDILRLTGSDPDEYQDYNFEDVLPDVMYTLNKQATVLEDVRNEFERICGTSGAHLATLENVYRLVYTMTDEDEIAKNLKNFKTYLGTLGTWLSTSKASTLVIDYISVQAPDTEAPKANANFFQSAWFEIRAFFASFFTDYDQMGVRDESALGEEALVVWIATGRDQSKVVRSLIDSDFSNYCKDKGYPSLAVSLKLVTAGTLLPSILAGKGPDVYMGLDSATVMNYAIREAVLPLQDQEGFAEHTGDNFAECAIDSVTLLQKTYGIPMSMSFAMMFYRMDFLVDMMGDNAKVPRTWDDLLSLLPDLQANNMEIGLNYTLALDFFLYQNGGNMWRYIDDPEYQGAQIGLDTDEGLRAFKFCCSLYTDYSFPVSYDAANRFRTGEMPIVIQDYVSLYNRLVVYATELDGLWSFSHIPGVEQSDGSINYTAIANVSSAIITKSAQERAKKTGTDRIAEAWHFVRWCTEADYVSQYSNRMVSILGPSAKYAAANLHAFDDMSWTSAERNAILEQIQHLDAIVNYPGSYIIARYTDFAFYAAVNDRKDAVEALRSYIGAINAEVTRKREEFGMKTLETGEVPPSYEHAGN